MARPPRPLGTPGSMTVTEVHPPADREALAITDLWSLTWRRPHGPVVSIEVTAWTGWAATGTLESAPP